MKQLYLYIPIAISMGMICARLIFLSKRVLIDSLEIAAVIAISLVFFVGAMFLTCAIIYDMNK